MGVTIQSKNRSIDLGYAGFFRLRIKVAEIVNKDLGSHYKSMSEGDWILDIDKRKKFWENYEAILIELIKKYKIPKGIIEFLYAPDCEYKLTYGKCKRLYEAIKDYDDNILYGYAGRDDCAKFKDFKKILKDCADNQISMRWL